MVCRWRRAPRAHAALALLLPSTCMPDHLLFLPVSDSLVFSFRCVSVSHFLSVSLSLCLACAYARALLRIQVNSSLPTVDVLAPLIKAIHASLSTSNPGHGSRPVCTPGNNDTCKKDDLTADDMEVDRNDDMEAAAATK